MPRSHFRINGGILIYLPSFERGLESPDYQTSANYESLIQVKALLPCMLKINNGATAEVTAQIVGE